jgi:hypothetical protein
VVVDLGEDDSRWRNDSFHVLYAEIDPRLIDEEMGHELKAITANGRIKYSYQLESVTANHPAAPISSSTSAAAISADRDCVAVVLTAGISNEAGI